MPLDFDERRPGYFGARPARREAMRTGPFVGDTREGGSCNVPELTLNPHCHGTHTESIGHILDEGVDVHGCLEESVMPAVLVTMEPVPASETEEAYRPKLDPEDRVITASRLAEALARYENAELSALVIRTRFAERRPCDEAMAHPFLTLDAVDCLNARGVRHLLVDVPSVDRMHDDGWLSVHRRFWGVADACRSLRSGGDRRKTITELVRVPEELVDGLYLLNLQIAPFLCDAAPSRPVLHALEPC